MSLSNSIAIDGPAGSGKSTIAKMLSEATGLPYLSTGEMYRAIALCVLRTGTDPLDENAVLECARKASISARPDGSGGFRIYCSDEDVTGLLRSAEVSRLSSPVAIHPSIRRMMVDLQRAIAREQDLIMDGRDIGTVVLRESAYKVYLDASVQVRALRRLADYANKGLTYEGVLKELQERDLRDSTRQIDPLRPAADSLIIDTTRLSPQEVVEAILVHIKIKGGGNRLA